MYFKKYTKQRVDDYKKYYLDSEKPLYLRPCDIEALEHEIYVISEELKGRIWKETPTKTIDWILRNKEFVKDRILFIEFCENLIDEINKKIYEDIKKFNGEIKN